MTDSNGNTVKLTGDQKRIMLVIGAAHEAYSRKFLAREPTQEGIKLVSEGNSVNRPIRETTTAAALARKGLVMSFGRKGRERWTPTLEGSWLLDALKIEDRQGKIPARRTR